MTSLLSLFLVTNNYPTYVQAKLRLEMENQRLEQQVKKSLEAREEEHDRQVNQLHKKIKSLQEQLDREYEEKSSAHRVQLETF